MTKSRTQIKMETPVMAGGTLDDAEREIKRAESSDTPLAVLLGEFEKRAIEWENLDPECDPSYEEYARDRFVGARQAIESAFGKLRNSALTPEECKSLIVLARHEARMQRDTPEWDYWLNLADKLTAISGTPE